MSKPSHYIICCLFPYLLIYPTFPFPSPFNPPILVSPLSLYNIFDFPFLGRSQWHASKVHWCNRGTNVMGITNHFLKVDVRPTPWCGTQPDTTKAAKDLRQDRKSDYFSAKITAIKWLSITFCYTHGSVDS